MKSVPKKTSTFLSLYFVTQMGQATNMLLVMLALRHRVILIASEELASLSNVAFIER